MAKRRRSGGSVTALAESWYGVSHNVPRRGTAAHASMVRKFLRAHPHSSAARHNPTTMYRIDWRGDDRIWVHGHKRYNSLRAAIKAASSKLRAVKDSLFDIEVINDDNEKTVWSGKDYYSARRSFPARKPGSMAARHNPIKTKREGRVLHPENCDSATTHRLLNARKAEGRKGVKHKTSRIGNCDYRSASYALAHHTERSSSGGSILSRMLPWWPSSK